MSIQNDDQNTEVPQAEQAASAPQSTGEGPTKDEKLLAVLAHILPLAVGFLAPLVIWLVKKDESAFIDDQAKEALNFQISMFIYVMASFLLCFVFIGFLLLPAVGIFGLIVMILAAVNSNDGIRYRYPLCIRFIS